MFGDFVRVWLLGVCGVLGFRDGCLGGVWRFLWWVVRSLGVCMCVRVFLRISFVLWFFFWGSEGKD